MGEIMRKYLAAVAVAAVAAMATPAVATTFPTLTTIYIGTGLRDDGGGQFDGIATVIHCSNVSGVTASVRFLLLNSSGGVGFSTTVSVNHGATFIAGTHNAVAYVENQSLGGAASNNGVINIESTQSGVFCMANTIDAAAAKPVGVPLRLVRVNPHPGTLE
jgi:hypothetical protein